MSRKYFWDPPGKQIGLKADIERHRLEAQYLDQRIQQAEEQGDSLTARVYRQFRYLLEVSKAEVVNRIGRRKP